MKIYTRTGDKGDTSLRWGERIAKDALRVEVYGDVDEANSFVGLALALWPDSAGAAAPAVLEQVHAVLLRVQRELFDVGADLASPPDHARGGAPKVSPPMVAALEADIDGLDLHLAPLRQFILPGGAPAAAALHTARTVCRRAERRLVTLMRQEAVDPVLVRYLNRLSDLLFVAARAVNAALAVSEPQVEWKSPGSPGPSG